MKNRIRFAAALIVVSLTGGCVAFQTYSVADIDPILAPTGQDTVLVASQDKRSYVVSGKKKPQVVGVLRAGEGIPYNMTTTSGRPFADEVGDVIAAALERRGFATRTVVVTPTETIAQVLSKLTDTDRNKLIHIQIIEWKSDTYVNIILEFTLNLAVLDREGRLLGETEISGVEMLGSAGFDTGEGVARKVPAAFKEKLEELFSDPAIIEALK